MSLFQKPRPLPICGRQSGRGCSRDLIGLDANGGSSKLRRNEEERDEEDEYEGNYSTWLGFL